jgi:hypothetical protein
MESESDTLKQLESLYHQAATPPERSMLLQTMRIVNPEACHQLEEILRRELVRGMPFEEIVAIIASQKEMTQVDARKAVADIVFDQLLDHAKMQALAAPSNPIPPPPPPPPAQTSRVASPPAPRIIPQVPAVQIREPPKEPVQMLRREKRVPAEDTGEAAAEPGPAKPGGSFFMPRNIPQE